MNFEIVNKRFFTGGINKYYRTYKATELRDGRIRIINILTGEILFDNLCPNSILINGVPMSSIKQLQQIIYNFSCVCEDEADELDDFKIFDNTFDNTFE